MHYNGAHVFNHTRPTHVFASVASTPSSVILSFRVLSSSLHIYARTLSLSVDVSKTLLAATAKDTRMTSNFKVITDLYPITGYQLIQHNLALYATTLPWCARVHSPTPTVRVHI